MKLTNKALEKIRGSRRIKNLIAAELNCTELTVRRWLAGTGQHEMLTAAGALKVIRQETGLSDSQILCEK